MAAVTDGTSGRAGDTGGVGATLGSGAVAISITARGAHLGSGLDTGVGAGVAVRLFATAVDKAVVVAIALRRAGACAQFVALAVAIRRRVELALVEGPTPGGRAVGV